MSKHLIIGKLSDMSLYIIPDCMLVLSVSRMYMLSMSVAVVSVICIGFVI